MLHTIIIDDESHIRVTLARFLSRHCPQVKLVGEANSVESGIKTIQQHHPNLVLLDVEMSDGTGFDLLKAMDPMDFKVIFVTAFEKYAIQAFRFSAVDFLLKPVDPLELKEAVARVSELDQSDYNTRLKALESNFQSRDPQSAKIILRTLENIYLLEVSDILFCESEGCYTYIYTSEGEKILMSKPIKEYDEMLRDNGFFRAHKSYLINLRHIRRFEKTEGGSVFLTRNHKLPVASRKKDELMELFEKMTN